MSAHCLCVRMERLLVPCVAAAERHAVQRTVQGGDVFFLLARITHAYHFRCANVSYCLAQFWARRPVKESLVGHDRTAGVPLQMAT